MSSLGQNPFCPGYGDPEIGKVRDDDTGLFPSRELGSSISRASGTREREWVNALTIQYFFLIFVLGI